MKVLFYACLAVASLFLTVGNSTPAFAGCPGRALACCVCKDNKWDCSGCKGSSALHTQSKQPKALQNNKVSLEANTTSLATTCGEDDCLCQQFKKVCKGWAKGICIKWLDECVKKWCKPKGDSR